MHRLRTFIKLWVSALSLVCGTASALDIPVGYIVYNQTTPGVSAEFDVINQTGPNSTGEPTWPVTTPVFLLSLSLTVDFSAGLPVTFGPSFFNLTPDGLSYNGPTIAIDGANPQPMSATLNGLFSPVAVTLFDSTTVPLGFQFSVLLLPTSGNTLQDQDLAVISGTTVPEPASSWPLVTGLAGILLLGRSRWVKKNGAPVALMKYPREIVRLLLSVAMMCALQPSVWAAATIKLNVATAPSTGVAGATNVTLTGSGFGTAPITASSVTISLAPSCGGLEAASTTALSIKTVVGTSRVIQFLVPGTLAQSTYFVSILGSDTAGVGFASSNCSRIDVTSNTVITSCREITGSGRYTLLSNLLETGPFPCINIHDAANVELDCALHTITVMPTFCFSNVPDCGTAITLTNVQKFSIRHCGVPSGGPTLLAVTNSNNGLIDGNSFGNLAEQRSLDVRFTAVNNTVFSNNTLNASLGQMYSNGNIFRFNMATCPVWTNNKICGFLFGSSYGTNNTFDSNQIDGRAPGSSNQGADDGIVIQDESGDIIANNIIRNTWDAGIETAGSITDTQITGNSITNVLLAGVSSYYWTSWRNVNVSNNTVDGTQFLFEFTRYYGLRPQNFNGNGAPADTTVFFQGNNFTSNKLLNGSQGSSYIPLYNYLDYYTNGFLVSGIPGELQAQPSDFRLGNNTFTQNDFGHTTPPPFFSSPVVAGPIIDGGGNVCANPGPNFPLVCK